MGDLFGGDKQTTTSTSEAFSGNRNNQFNELYPYLRSRANNPQQYTGQYTAPINGTGRQAIDLMKNYANNAMLSDTASGKYIDPTTNKYLGLQADIISHKMGEQFGDATDVIDSRVNRSGFWGGSGHQALMEKARNDVLDRQGEALTNLYGNAYDQERTRQMQALGMQSSLADALMRGGEYERNISDTDLQRRREQWLAEQGLANQDIQNLLNYFSVGRNPTTTQTTEGGSGLGDVFGTVLGKMATKWI